MARHGRRFPLSTQYQSARRVVPTNPLTGAGAWTLTGSGSLTVVTDTIIESSPDIGQHRFRAATVPALESFDQVKDHLQRSLDEIARAVNPIRSVADGGTGLSEVTAGALMAGTDSEAMETIPVGAAFEVLMSDGAMPRYSAAPPVWRRFTVVFGDFAVAALTGTKTIYALPARHVVHAAVVKHSASFTGGAIASYTLSVGIAGTPTKYTPALNVFAAPSNTGFAQSPTGLNIVENMGASTNIIVTATSSGANLNAATAGAAEILLLVAALPTS